MMRGGSKTDVFSLMSLSCRSSSARTQCRRSSSTVRNTVDIAGRSSYRYVAQDVLFALGEQCEEHFTSVLTVQAPSTRQCFFLGRKK